jgi:hypothetical protein
MRLARLFRGPQVVDELARRRFAGEGGHGTGRARRKEIPDEKIGEGVTETTKGIGNTVAEGAEYSGERGVGLKSNRHTG